MKLIILITISVAIANSLRDNADDPRQTLEDILKKIALQIDQGSVTHKEYTNANFKNNSWR